MLEENNVNVSSTCQYHGLLAADGHFNEVNEQILQSLFAKEVCHEWYSEGLAKKLSEDNLETVDSETSECCLAG